MVTDLPLAMWTVVHDQAGPRVVGSVMGLADLCAWADAAGVSTISTDPAGESVTYSACWVRGGIDITLQCRSVAAVPEELP
jgi:hypothetical protein